MEGADLAVRDNRVYLKTLTGLDPVDLIVRRLDDDFCDPIELRGDSLLGVPGLVQAVRSGSVVIDNALGSGVLEAPGMHGCSAWNLPPSAGGGAADAVGGHLVVRRGGVPAATRWSILTSW